MQWASDSQKEAIGNGSDAVVPAEWLQCRMYMHGGRCCGWGPAMVMAGSAREMRMQEAGHPYGSDGGRGGMDTYQGPYIMSTHELTKPSM